MSSYDPLSVCRLCLTKAQQIREIFADVGEDDVSTDTKIHTWLPIKVLREDKFSHIICESCFFVVDQAYNLWKTCLNADKQLREWQSSVNTHRYTTVTTMLDQDIMKGEQSNENRLDGSVMSGHQNSMNMDMDNMQMMSIMMPNNNQQQLTSVPIDTSGGSIQNIQVIAGSSTQPHEIIPSQTNVPTQQEEEEDESTDDSEDEGDEGDEGLPIKEESEEDPNNSRTIEPTTFVNVSLHCDEAGPSGIRQQKISDIQELAQAADIDPKTGGKKWSFKTCQKVVATDGVDQNVSLFILQEIDDKAVLVEKVIAYRCDSCDEDFDTKANLIIHRTEQSIIKTREALRQAEKRYECDVCEQTFSRKLQLMNHYRVSCKYSTSKSEKCESKGTIAKIKRNLKTSNKAEPIKCDKCQKVFKKKRYLKVHKMFHDSPHICHLCGAKLTSEYCLNIHIRRHNKEFTEFCEICNKGFYLKAALKLHMSVHTDEKPSTCKICHKSFGNSVYLQNHMKLHSQPEMRKRFKCEICGFETFYKYCYKEHMWTHSGESQVACEVCGKLITRQYIKIHTRIHTGDKPEICEFCGKTYSARRYLIKHQRTHTGEKPYKCDICHKHFTQRGTLSRHLRGHENKK